MENRIRQVQEYVDSVIGRLTDESARRYAYIHLYGVAQNAALFAMRRGQNVELAVIAGLLHDIYSYAMTDSVDHARKSAAMAKSALEKMGTFTEQEIRQIFSAIYCHSEKEKKHPPFEEVLIDADVMQHCLYHPLYAAGAYEQERFVRIKKELKIPR